MTPLIIFQALIVSGVMAVVEVGKVSSLRRVGGKVVAARDKVICRLLVCVGAGWARGVVRRLLRQAQP